MDIRNVGKNGGVEPGSDRPKPIGSKPVVIPFPPKDEASISRASRESAAAIATLAERARNSSSERAEIVAAAKAKLLGGELDGEAVVRATAQKLLDAKFLSA